MIPRRRSDIGVGLGAAEVPYDQSGGQQMPGMEIPQPGGTMRKMQFEFTDPAEAQAQAQPQIPEGAGVLPAGAQQAPVMPTGAQGQEQPQEQGPGLLAGLAPQMGGMQQGMPQGPDSSMMTDDQLAGLVQDDPNELMGQQMSDQAFQDPQLQQQLMEAARRRLMGGGY
jgi:hypothetical protein